ncbi:MAG TPA: Gfo/Idh/MocA family oxidoreductase [Thermoguttaceae bacterium]|nr:Gfo/Idh/MocA family oxidoreductase [Thermoguttaceae bacterium]
MKLRVGLIGMGGEWHSRHGPALRALADRFEVRAVCEQVSHLAEQAAIEFGATTVDGYQELTRREDIDAVLILATQWYGALPILAACESGKAVYCAAGLDLEPDEAQLVKQRVEQAGIAFMVEFPRRQAPATVRLKELIATRLGAPRLLFCHRRAPIDKCKTYPTGSAPGRRGRSDLLELVDWCSYVVGRKPSRVTGLMHPGRGHFRLENPDAVHHIDEDYQMMSLEFPDENEQDSTQQSSEQQCSEQQCSESGRPGPIAQISCGRYFPADWKEAISYRPLAELQVSCEHGVAFVDLPSTLIWFDEAGRHQEMLDSERPAGEQLMRQFYRSVTSLVRKASDLEDAYRAMLIVQQAQVSHRDGRRIEL